MIDPLESYTQYTLVNENGEQAEHYHQDDETNPILGESVEELLDLAADWADMGVDDFVAEMQPGGEYAKYQILREEITRHKLTDEEQRQVDALRTEA